jgi:hypothetical protein
MSDVHDMPVPSCPSMPNDDGDEASLCSICHVDETVIECSGSIPHGFCRDCFQGYARANFELNAEYERERDRGGRVSAVGSLPCPHFIQGACTCTAIDPSLLRRFVDDDTFDMWRQADIRIGMAALLREQEEAEARQGAVEEQRTPLGNLRHAVLEALTKGGTVCCPQCKTKGEKDDQCMHIKCESCNTEWCYCCGRPRGSNGTRSMCSRQNGCDAMSPYLENQPGWDHFAIGDESPGQGALHEFHRRRIAYFLKQLKECTGATLWAELRLTYPDVLDDVPTAGRSVDWDAIDTAEIPTFGDTRPVDVRWAEEGREILADLEARRREALERQDVIELQSNRKTILQRKFAQYIAEGVPRSTWILVTLHAVFIIGLLCASIAVRNELIKGCLAASLCVYVVILLSLAIGSAIDGRYSVLLNQEDEWALPYAEVQFCGSREEAPYLSAVGRWGRARLLYVFALCLCLAFGVAMTAFFHGWSHNRCISYRGLCGLGPALLAFTGMVFGGGTLILNLSPPPVATAYRYPKFKKTMCQLIILGGVFVPAGVYLMVGFADDNTYHSLWIIGSVIIGLSMAAILGDLSYRCLSPRGFALDRGEFLFNKKFAFFWLVVIVGFFMLGTAELGNSRLVMACVLILGPVLCVLLQKIRTPDYIEKIEN